jgi:hypothetical protein
LGWLNVQTGMRVEHDKIDSRFFLFCFGHLRIIQGKENAVEVLALFRRNGETMRSPEVLRFTYATSTW